MRVLLTIICILFSQTLYGDDLSQLLGYEQREDQVVVYDTKQFEGYSRSLMTLHRSFREPLPFYLAEPTVRPIKGVVFLLHGITSSKEIWWQDEGPYSNLHDYKNGLLHAGYVVIAPDSRVHGQRSHLGKYESPKNLLAQQDWYGVRDLIAGSARDFRRLIDLAEQRYPESKIGVLGMSLGALQTLVLAAADDRVDFAVPVFPPIMDLSPVLELVHPYQLAKQIKVPTLLLISDQDVWYKLEQGEALFDKIVAADKKLLILSTPHELGYSRADDVMEWIINRE